MKCYESKAANWLTSQRRHWISGKQWSPKIRLQSLLQQVFEIVSLICAQIWPRMWSQSRIMKKMLTFKISQSIFILPYSKKQKSLISCVVSERVSEWVLQWMTRAEWMTSDRTIKRVSQRGNEKNSRGSEWVSERVGERGSTHCGTNQRAKQEWIIDDQQAVEMKLHCRPVEHHPAASHHLLRSQRAHPAVSSSCQYSSSSSCLK